jgi:mannose-6-phosphate isomerase-like protein (cupin superfamily)
MRRLVADSQRPTAQLLLAECFEVTVLLTRQSVLPLDFDGLRIFDYTAGRSGSSSVALIEVEPGGRHKEAWSRRSDKYYLVISGQISFALEGSEQLMSAGDFCVVERGRRFSYSNESGKLATLVLVHTPSFDLAEEVFVEQ